MQELELLPETLNCIANQFGKTPFHVYICVNQPDSWWHTEEKLPVCRENYATLELLSNESRFPLTVLDYTSQGKGWKGKQSGVGHARKVLFDTITTQAEDHDVVISLDGDTVFGITYFESVRKAFERFPNHVGLMVSYYHRLTGHDIIDRAILRYEIYMRCYALNLWRIGSPYNFTALGSAMAVRVKALKAVGGITPYNSGEDFYLAQKLRKYGELILSASDTVYPSARLSDRVAFGTGPALIKGIRNIWDSYPIYPPETYNPLKATFELFPKLFKEDCPTPIDDFLRSQFPNQDIWNPLRGNFKTEQQFVRACHQKIDGLRTLQYLKFSHKKEDDNTCLIKNFREFFGETIDSFDFANDPIDVLNTIRNYLFEKEHEWQRNAAPITAHC